MGDNYILGYSAIGFTIVKGAAIARPSRIIMIIITLGPYSVVIYLRSVRECFKNESFKIFDWEYDV